MGAFVIFVSHQWNSFNHPDPSGRQMQVLSKVMRDLRDGRYKTETDPFHVLLYKNNTITSPKEWNELLTNAYIWYDWYSQPQPTRGTSEDEVAPVDEEPSEESAEAEEKACPICGTLNPADAATCSMCSFSFE